ncbi:UDP-3-O-(3-hydroxymyristoyl)glucosamine N-acyltransferase [Sulfitobacter sp. S0837]|uniref:UDP-3-O-(3-hydroxymyristoyl)glucosamine N-acyltransferase n=1 Tax=Sulfitobacter maritimus TaxID=2741719 RepID=UPI0015839047|nr:UDP-3-O-(3-hydroxymyristoyl)glucosamine N-acyltransferase [Sulfitobacter maritimus]NUH64273.1 UDP-3-O-(3-hydroxymyristoyl)glucosamine N-acyltransferase [Sulfitobacter maritimus]
MTFSVQQIAEALGAQAEGDTTLQVTSVAEPASAKLGEIALATDPRYASSLAQGSAEVAMLWEGADWQALGLKAAILPNRPRYALSGLTRMLDKGQGFEPGIHPSAIIDPAAELGEGVSVGPLAVISAGARIGAGTVIGPLCFIGVDAQLGEGCFLREHVSIGARVTIGARFIAQSGVRLGGDGFSFVTAELSTVEKARQTLGDQGDAQPQPWTRIHSLGAVSIGADVEMGMGSTIDNGTIRDTQVGDGTKIDNLVHIGHNAIVGRNCLLCGQAGVGGSTRVGDNVVLGGQVGLADNITIGDRVIAGGGTIVLSNVPEGRTMLGYPATQMSKQTEIYKALRRLPRLLRDVAALQKSVSKADKGD